MLWKNIKMNVLKMENELYLHKDISKEDFIKFIKFTHGDEIRRQKGGQHVAMLPTYIKAEIEDLDLSVTIGYSRSVIYNKNAAIDILYETFLKYYAKE